MSKLLFDQTGSTPRHASEKPLVFRRVSLRGFFPRLFFSRKNSKNRKKHAFSTCLSLYPDSIFFFLHVSELCRRRICRMR
jgi:hypothetical protein